MEYSSSSPERTREGKQDERPQVLSAPEMYLSLLKKVLARDGFGAHYRPVGFTGPATRWLSPLVRSVLARRGLSIMKLDDPSLTDDGRALSIEAETMIGRRRLDNLEQCITDVIARSVPGDLIETGVWRGGATIFMRGVLRAYGETTRTVWVADSFQGLPKPDAVRFPADEGDRHWESTVLAVSEDEVRKNFERYDLLDKQVRFLPGWFRDTLATAPIESLAILRLDGDMYESTRIALESLYPKVSSGGYVIVDDYGAVNACKKAVDEYRFEHGIVATMHRIDWTGSYWQKP